MIAIAHPKWQERPLLIVVKKRGSEVTKQELLDYLADKVAKWWLPEDVVFVDQIPHTATGKLQKMKLRERVLAITSSAISKPSSSAQHIVTGQAVVRFFLRQAR